MSKVISTVSVNTDATRTLVYTVPDGKVAQLRITGIHSKTSASILEIGDFYNSSMRAETKLPFPEKGEYFKVGGRKIVPTYYLCEGQAVYITNMDIVLLIIEESIGAQ